MKWILILFFLVIQVTLGLVALHLAPVPWGLIVVFLLAIPFGVVYRGIQELD